MQLKVGQNFPKKEWYHQKNLENILMAKRILRRMTLQLRKDKIHLETIPAIFWPQIVDKMSISSIIKSQTVSKKFNYFVSKVNGSFNPFYKQLTIFFHPEDGTFDFNLSGLDWISIKNVEEFLKSALLFNWITILIISPMREDNGEKFNISFMHKFQNVLRSGQLIHCNRLILIGLISLETIAKFFRTNILDHEIYMDKRLQDIPSELRAKETSIVNIPEILPFERLIIYSRITFNLGTIDTDMLVEFLKKFTSKPSKGKNVVFFGELPQPLDYSSTVGFSKFFKDAFISNLHQDIPYTESFECYILQNEKGIFILESCHYSDSSASIIEVTLFLEDFERIFFWIMEKLTTISRLRLIPIDFSIHFEEFLTKRVEEFEEFLTKMLTIHPFVDPNHYLNTYLN